MSVFIEVTTDAFQDRFDQIKDSKKKTRRAGADNVRRPLRGLEIKDDTYAILKVINSNGEQIPLVDGGDPTGKSTDYTNFIIQSVQEARMEKHQIVETFGESYIFFFGEAPRFLDVQCVLIDSNDFNWEAEFWENYNRFFRGTKLVEMGARTYLFYDDNIVEGYMLNAQAQKNSQQPLMVQLSFRLYLTNYSNVSLIGDPNFPVRGSLILPPEVSDINEITQDRGKYLATLGANLQNAGFGGGSQFQRAFSEGGSFADVPEQLYGVFLNAIQALGELDKRSIDRALVPLRSKIADNKDEMTLAAGALTTGEEALHNQLYDVEDLVNQALEELKNAGSTGNPSSMFQKLGFGPRFAPWGRPGGVGVSGGLGVSVSFSARASASGGIGGRANAGAGASFGASVGASASVGIGGGLGLSGRAGGGFGGGGGFNPQAPYAPNYAQDPTLSKRSAVVAGLNKASFGDLVDYNYFKSTSFQQSKGYNNGVGVGVGLSLGVGIGGGIGKPFQVNTWAGTGPAPDSFGYAANYGNYGQQLGWGNYGLPGAGGGFSGGGDAKGDQGGYAGAYGQNSNAGGSGSTANPYAGNPNAFGVPYNPLFDPNSGPGGYPIGYNSAYGSPYGSPYDPGFGGAPPGFNRGAFSNPYAGPGNGGASVTVVGTPTAFALISTSGSLTPGGGTKTTAYFSTF